jgi:hypothetical protein
LELSPIVEPASTLPCRWIAPVRARIASRSVVFPLWKGPTNAMHRGPFGLLPLVLVPFAFASVIDASLGLGARRETAGFIPAVIRRRKAYALRTLWRWQEAVPERADLAPASIARR